jgi:hypothetical protein
MRASDLLDRRAVDEDGRFVGHVVGLRAVQDGPPVGSTALLRIHEVLLSRRHIGSWLGYQNPEQKGPWLLAAAVRRLHRSDVVVAWDDVLDWDGGGDLKVRTPRREASARRDAE